VILPASLEGIPVDDLSQSEQARLQLEDLQEQTDTRIASVLSVLWAYEEAVAYSIAETLIGFETHEYTQAPDRALAIVSCAEVMISSMEALGLPPSAADDGWLPTSPPFFLRILILDNAPIRLAAVYPVYGQVALVCGAIVPLDGFDVQKGQSQGSRRPRHRRCSLVQKRHPQERRGGCDAPKQPRLVDQLVVLLREAYQGVGGPDTPMSAPDPNVWMAPFARSHRRLSFS